jgi:cobalamin biosynthesis protein CobT
MANFNKTTCEENFTLAYREVPQGLGATKAHLLRVLRSIDLIGWSSYEEPGRLDRKAFTRYAAGAVNIFSTRQYAEAQKSAVSILIDCSGSMDHDNRIITANKVAVQLARILEKANAEYSVTGFFGNGYGEHEGQTGASQRLSYSVQTPVFIPFKLWNESLAKASTKMGAINQCATGSTPDYGALSLKIEELATRPEHRKVLFLLTDADGYNKAQMRKLQKVADAQGVVIVAIGIGRTEVQQCFKHAENVTDVADLAGASLNKLLRVVERA